MDFETRLISKIGQVANEQIGQSVFSGLVARKIKGNYILMYHGVTAEGSTRFNRRHTALDCFERQIGFLKKHFSIISLDDFFEGRYDDKKTNFVLTFDDGYANNFTYAKPVLEKYKCPATFFVTGLNQVGDDILWADYVNIASTFTNSDIEIEGETFFKKGDIYYSAESGKSIYQIIKNERPSYDYKQKVKTAFRKYVNFESDPSVSEYWHLMSDEQIAQMSKSKFLKVGSHGYYHNNLGITTNDEACEELNKAKKYLENLTQQEVKQLAYPDGSYTVKLTESAYSLGFKVQLAADSFMKNESSPHSYLKKRCGVYAIDSCLNQIFTAIKERKYDEALLKLENPPGDKQPVINKPKLAEPVLKILLVARTMAHGGGAESLVFNIYNELKKTPGVHVKLVSLRKSDLFKIKDTDYFEKQLAGDPDFYFCNSYVNLSILGPTKKDLTEFEEIVKTFKPDIIHTHLFIAEILAHEVVFPGIKYFTHFHDNMRQLRNFSPKTLFKKELLTDFYEKKHLVSQYLACNNKFISISADTTKYFNDVLPKKLAKNIYSLDNAIVTEGFNKINHKRDLSKIRILNVGSFQAKKNQRFLIDIAEELIKQGQDVEVVMLGNGDLYSEVKQLVESKGLQKNILMPGNVVNVEDYYAAANVYVHSATYEPFGLVLLEAMASGLPVVSLDGKGNRLLIKDGENGYMIYEQDASAFAKTISQIVKNEKGYETMSKNAIAFAKQYDIKEYVKKLLLLYRKAN